MSRPVVSVALTVFERENFLRQAIRSVLAQTSPGFEIIVADDSNKWSIDEICRSFGPEPRLKYRGTVKTLGVALNVRSAIQQAEGKYIAILNDDDSWEPAFLEKLVSALEEDPKRVLAFSDHWIMRGDGVRDAAETEANWWPAPMPSRFTAISGWIYCCGCSSFRG
jgi:glycosyltransferase involved in cell wall biosynthesis